MEETAEKTRFAEERESMVERHLAKRGIYDEAVLEAMRTVPREAFVPEDMAEFAYADAPLPIGEGQTISQPYTVALMTEELELEGDERVLDVGTGSGYAAAVLSRIARASEPFPSVEEADISGLLERSCFQVRYRLS